VLHLLNVGYMENHTTSEALARMINEGLTATASKEDVKALEDRVTTRLDRIETLLMEEQKRKIENLETRMKNSKTPSPFRQHSASEQE
jgi:hypothetical protein